jgi:hypothetical protein
MQAVCCIASLQEFIDAIFSGINGASGGFDCSAL